MSVDWYLIKQDAFTVIRLEFPVQTLQVLAAEDNETPVSGDALARRKADLVKARS